MQRLKVFAGSFFICLLVGSVPMSAVAQEDPLFEIDWDRVSLWNDPDPIFLPETPGSGPTLHCGVGYQLTNNVCVKIGGYYQADPRGLDDDYGATVGISIGF